MSDPLHTPLCEKLGIEYPIVAFTHCKDVAVAVINAGGFAVLGEALHTPEHIRADIRWMRERIGDKNLVSTWYCRLLWPQKIPWKS